MFDMRERIHQCIYINSNFGEQHVFRESLLELIHCFIFLYYGSDLIQQILIKVMFQ